MDTQQTIRQQLSAWLDGELEPQEANRLQELLKTDPVLARELEYLKKVRQLVGGLPREKAPGGLWQRIMSIARAARSGRQVQPVRARTISLVWGRLAAAAAVVVTVGVGIGVGLNLKQWTEPQNRSVSVAINKEKPDAVTAVAKFVPNPSPAPKIGNKAGETGSSKNKPEEPAKRQLAPDDLRGDIAYGKPSEDKGHGRPVETTPLPGGNISAPPEFRNHPDEKLPQAVAGQGWTVKTDADQRKDGKEQQIVELACASISDVRKNVSALLAQNGVSAEAMEIGKAQEGRNKDDNLRGVAAVNRPDTIMIQVSLNREQYDKVRMGLDKIKSEQLAIRNRDQTNERQIASTKDIKGDRALNFARMEEFLKKIGDSISPGGSPADPSAKKTGKCAKETAEEKHTLSDAPGEAAQKDENSKLAMLTEESKRKRESEKTPGSNGSQVADSGKVTAGFGEGGGGGAPSKLPAEAPSHGRSNVPLAPPAACQTASQPADMHIAATLQSGGRKNTQQTDKLLEQQAQQQKLIVLTIVLNSCAIPPANAAQPQADAAAEPATRPAQGK